MKCPSSLTHLYLMHLLHAPCCPYALIPISHKGFFEQLPLLIVPLRPPCQFQLTLAFLLTIAFLLTLDLWRVYFAEPQSPTGPKKRIQGGDCCPRRMSLLRFPWLFPIRNPSELRGLHCHSYFGPRTCGRGITNVIEVRS
jgi:hypothetical protein